MGLKELYSLRNIDGEDKLAMIIWSVTSLCTHMFVCRSVIASYTARSYTCLLLPEHLYSFKKGIFLLYNCIYFQSLLFMGPQNCLLYPPQKKISSLNIFFIKNWKLRNIAT